MTEYLTDEELIDRIIKFSNDPEKVRLATIMERTKGSIWDDLVDAGMDETYCTFDSEWGSSMHVGQYINHLREEITIRDDELYQLRRELEEQKARTIADLIAELNQQITTEKYIAAEARRDRDKAVDQAKEATEKLKMWDHLRKP